VADDVKASEVEGKKRLRSPPYPMFDLSKAVERVYELHKAAQQHSVGANVLADAWSMSSSDGKVWRAAAALIQYGLLTDSGTGKTRKFQLTDAAKRLALDRDANSTKRIEVIKKAALAPMIHAELWRKFGSCQNYSASVLTTYLTIDREDEGGAPYNPAAVDEVLKTFRDTLDYAGLTDSDTVAEPAEAIGEGQPLHLGPMQEVHIGDLVKWTSGGIDQFTARKVNWISDDATHLRVIGSNTGIPMNEVSKVSAQEATMPPFSPTPPAEKQPQQASQATGKSPLNASASIMNGRLQVSADVAAGDIDALISVLEKYKEILTLMH
jgi:hypothetical protein